MKKVINKILLKIKSHIPFILFILFFSIVSFYIGKQVGLNTDTSSSNVSIEDIKVTTGNIKKVITSTGQIEALGTEKLTLNTSYTFNYSLVEVGDFVKKGEKLVMYSNGKYLTAPYDLIVNSMSLPLKGKKATSSHYIDVSDVSSVIVNISINENEIMNVSNDDNVEITLTSDATKKYTGVVSKINNVGTYSSSGSVFETKVVIENDGYLKIGMSASCTINVEERSDVLVVPIEAVHINDSRRFVLLVEGNETKEVDVVTGLSDDKNVEIKSGLTTNDVVRVVTIITKNTIRNTSSNSSDSSHRSSSSHEGKPPSRSSSSERR